MRRERRPWFLARLPREWSAIAGLTFAAGMQAMRFSAAAYPVAAAGATFEVVGIDFLVDEQMKPWLLEVNAVPSLARQVRRTVVELTSTCEFRSQTLTPILHSRTQLQR